MFRSESFAHGSRRQQKQYKRARFNPAREVLETRQLMAIDLTEFSPVGIGLAYEASAEGEIIAAGVPEVLELDLNPNNLVSLRVDSASELMTSVTVFGPDGETLASESAAENSDGVTLNAIRPTQSGQHRFVFRANDNSTGSFRFDVLLDGSFEQETLGETANNTLADAENVNNILSLFPSTTNSFVTTILGETDGDVESDVFAESFESMQLSISWSVEGDVRILEDFGATDGSNSLVLSSDESISRPLPIENLTSDVTIHYDPQTGEVSSSSDKQLTTLEIKSERGLFVGDRAASLSGLFDLSNSKKLFKLDPAGFSNLVLGTLPTGLSLEEVRADLSVDGSQEGGGRPIFRFENDVPLQASIEYEPTTGDLSIIAPAGQQIHRFDLQFDSAEFQRGVLPDGFVHEGKRIANHFIPFQVAELRGVLPTGLTDEQVSSQISVYARDENGFGYSVQLPTSERASAATFVADLTGIKNPVLQFSHLFQNVTVDALPNDFSGDHDGDGISISSDGVRWQKIYEPTKRDSDSFENVSIDLASAVANSTVDLDGPILVKMNHFSADSSDNGTQAFDEIRIHGRSQDLYSVSLESNESIEVMLNNLQPDDQLSVRIFDEAGTQLFMPFDAEDGSMRFEGLSDSEHYFIDVGGTAEEGTPYALTIAKNLDWENGQSSEHLNVRSLLEQ